MRSFLAAIHPSAVKTGSGCESTDSSSAQSEERCVLQWHEEDRSHAPGDRIGGCPGSRLKRTRLPAILPLKWQSGRTLSQRVDPVLSVPSPSGHSRRERSIHAPRRLAATTAKTRACAEPTAPGARSGSARRLPRVVPARRPVAGSRKPRRVHKRFRQMNRMAVSRLVVPAQAPRHKREHKARKMRNSDRVQAQKSLLVRHEPQTRTALRVAPADPTVPRRATATPQPRSANSPRSGLGGPAQDARCSPPRCRKAWIVLAREPIRVILINDLGSRSEGEGCAVATRLSVGRSLSLV